MRPLHSLLVLLAVLLFGCVAWFLARTNDPGTRVTAAGPVAAQPSAPDAARTGADLRAPDAAPATQGRTSSLVAGTPAAAGDPAAGGAQPDGALVGRVLDGFGAPLEGARVLAAAGDLPFFGMGPIDGFQRSIWFEVAEVHSDAQGRFRFADLPGGALKLAVRHPGFAPYDADDVARPATAGEELAPITLTPGVFVSGRVVDAGGRPVPGARVLRLPPSTGDLFAPTASGGAPAATTAGDGSFLVDCLAVGSWALRIESERHPHAGVSGRTQAAGERVEGLLVQLEESADIAGRVTGESPSGRDLGQLRVRARPESGAGEPDQVRAEARTAAVGADGGFVVRGLRLGRRYSLSVRDQPAGGGDLLFDFAPSLAAPVQADAGERGVVLVLSPEAALRFAVVDARDGTPIESYTVDAGIDWKTPQLDENGRRLRQRPGGLARVGNLRPRSLGERAELRIESLGYLPYEASGLALTPGMDTDLGTIALEPAPVLSVRVVDDQTGAAVPGARVTLSEVLPQEDSGDDHRMRISFDLGDGDEDAIGPALGDRMQTRARTDEQGLARLTSTAGLDLRLRVQHDEHAEWSSEVFKGSAGAQEREVRLLRGGSVVVHLFDAAGEPLPGARVEHRAPGAPDLDFSAAGAKVSNTAGEVTFAHLAAGRHRFRPAKATAGGVFNSGDNSIALVMGDDGQGGAEWVSVDVVEGGLHDVEIHAPLTLVVWGVVTEGGEPLADARLSLVSAPEPGVPMSPMAMFSNSGPRTVSDDDGSFRFEAVEPGEYTLRVEHPSRTMPAEVALRVLDSDVQRDVDLDVAILEGRVTDEAGEPLAGIEVWPERARTAGARPVAVRVMAFAGSGGGASMISIEEGGFSAVRARSDDEGRYTLRGVQADVDLEVRGKGVGLQPARSEVVRVAPGGHRTGVDLRMQSAGSIEVVGARADGAPAANLMITATYEGGLDGVEPRTVLLDEHGRTTIDELAPGSWRLRARTIGPGEEDDPIPDTVVEVRVGEATPVTISAP